jgi:hypothetical protein
VSSEDTVGTIHNLTNQDKILKEWYTDDKLKEMSYGENPLYGFIRKERGKAATGRRYVQPIEFAHPDGSSADFVKAMTNGTSSQYEDFLIPRKKQYQRVQVDQELLFATEDTRGAFQKAMNEFDRGLRGLGEKIGRRMYRTQGGSMGQMNNSTVATAVITLLDKASAFNFMIGQTLAFSTTDGTGSLLDGGDTTTVTSVAFEDGLITCADTLNTKIAGITTTSFVFMDGDYNACLAGLESWLPVDGRSAALAASFNNVTRSQMPELLGGIFMDGTSMGGLDEVIIKLVGKIGKYGGQTSHVFANPESLSDLELLSNSKMRIVGDLNSKIIGGDGDILVGFSGYRAIVGGRSVKIYPDRNCPSNRLYALQLDTWTLWHTGDLINWLGEMATGSKLQPSQNDDALEARLGAYMNLGCSAPGWNGVAKINAAT